jgi:hypothetical protein
MEATASADVRARAALATPLVDAVAAGAGSLALAAAMLAVGPDVAGPWLSRAFLPLSFLLNWPHFMASYHLLYTTPGATLKHPFATKLVPAGLCVYALVAAAALDRAPMLLKVFHAAATVYLAWHYTGQAWGTMAAFAGMEGTPFDEKGRLLMRANMCALLAFHAVWAASLVARLVGPEIFEPLYKAVSALAGVSAALGAAALWGLRQKHGRLPWRVFLPWAAVHVWYALIYSAPAAVYWVQLAQLSHAAQYLVFPLRVRANREARAGRPQTPKTALAYYGALSATGLLAFWALPEAATAAAGWAGAFPEGKAAIAGMIVGDLLAIHHYFVDGCIWKLGDPEVRRDLFRHLEPSRR